MRAGALERIAVVWRDVGTTRTEYGGIISNWIELATVRAAVVRSEASEAQGAGGWQSDATITLRLRWMDDLKVSDRIEVRACDVIKSEAVYGIVSVAEIGRRRGLEVTVRRLAP